MASFFYQALGKHGYISLGMSQLGYNETVLPYFKAVLGFDPTLRIVELGSGNNVVAAILMGDLKRTQQNYITVDDGSGHKQKDFLPLMGEDFELLYKKVRHQFSTISQLCAADEKKKRKEKTLLFINWPGPTRHEEADSFELDGIRRLEPDWVIVIYDCTGGSGTFSFQKWMHFNGVSHHSIYMKCFQEEVKKQKNATGEYTMTPHERVFLHHCMPSYRVVRTTTMLMEDKMHPQVLEQLTAQLPNCANRDLRETYSLKLVLMAHATKVTRKDIKEIQQRLKKVTFFRGKKDLTLLPTPAEVVGKK